jgi:hypothetical protein
MIGMKRTAKCPTLDTLEARALIAPWPPPHKSVLQRIVPVSGGYQPNLHPLPGEIWLHQCPGHQQLSYRHPELTPWHEGSIRRSSVDHKFGIQTEAREQQKRQETPEDN